MDSREIKDEYTAPISFVEKPGAMLIEIQQEQLQSNS